jgi:uncharacterized protein (DUF736 family)
VAENPKSSRFRGLREELDLGGGWEVMEAFGRDFLRVLDDISGKIWWVLGRGLKFAKGSKQAKNTGYNINLDIRNLNQ